MKNLLDTILNFIFPTTCLVCRNGTKLICESCFFQIPTEKRDHLNTLSVYRYRNKNVNSLLWNLKYKHVTSVADVFGETLAKELSIWLASFPSKVEIVLVPMPLNNHDRRLNNHAMQLAISISKHLQNSIVVDVLSKDSNKKQAHTRNKHERIRNVENTFTINKYLPEKIIKNLKTSGHARIYIIVDDVITTGASITNAKYTLAEYLGIPSENILGVTVAH